MPIFEINPNLKIHYLDHNPAGERTALLLHGLGATAESWQLQIPALNAAGYRTVAIDQRGFGQSTYPGGGMSIADMAGDAIALLQHLGISSADVIGISMGGTVAQQLTLNAPKMVNRLVLINTFAKIRAEGIGQWFYFALRMALVHTLGVEKQAKVVSERLFPEPEQAELREMLRSQIAQADPRGYRAAMRALARFNIENRLSEIQSPTLVITGSEDTTVSPHDQQALAERISQAQQVTIQGAGHPLTVSHPQKVNEILLNFLNTTQ